MRNNKYLYLISLLVLFTLLIRDLPYINVAIIGRIWILYLLILLVVVLTSLKFQYQLVLWATYLLFVVAFVFTLLAIPFVAESIGILIYFALWVLLGHAVLTSIRKKV